MKNTMKLRSGVSIHEVRREEADTKRYLTREALMQMHLIPDGEPVAFGTNGDGSLTFYFDPEKVTEAPPEYWYFPNVQGETMVLPSGSTIEKMSAKRAALYGYYTKDRLAGMNYEPVEEPVAYTLKGSDVHYFYDKRTANRLPLMCTKCGKAIRFKRKLCRACYEEDLAIRRAEGEAHRNTYFGMDPKKVLFFDLELTGFYDHDEIISITIIDGNAEMVMDTLVKPAHTKKWKRTEKIHGITPDMVADSPLLVDLIPRLKEIFAGAENLIAYGVSTDYSHIKYIYDTEEERKVLYDKTRDCAAEFVRYIHENRPEIEHAALIDAMDCLQIDWEGIPHSSIADTYACRKVWNKLFPHYYEVEGAAAEAAAAEAAAAEPAAAEPAKEAE